MSSEGSSIKVAVRCRPFSENEKSKTATRVVKMSGEKIIVHNPLPGSSTKEHSFTFDHSYFWDAKTEQLYHDLGTPLLRSALNGYNVTLLVYGQIGTGKTFSIKGSEEEPGIAPLLNQDLFKHIDEAPPNKKFFVTVSYYEIYQESINDLLNPSGYELRVRQHPQLGIYVEGLAELVVQNADDIARLYEQGNRVKKLASADKSPNASRSSSVFTICVEQRHTDNGSPGTGIRSKIILADMAGSERSDGAEISVKQGAVFFNKGVNAFNAVVSSFAASTRKEGHIPYRDSKITRILQDSLGGTSVTTMLITVSPADADFEDTLASLQCGNKVKNIRNMIKTNEIENIKIIKDLREEITRLREKLSKTGVTSGPNKDDVTQMEELIKDLQTAKRQTWEEKERLSENYDEERRLNLANKGILDWVMDTMKRDNKEVQERLMVLQKEKDELTTEFKEKRKLVDELKDDLQNKITEYSKLTESGKGSEDELKTMVSTIHNIKEKLKGENDELKKIKHKLKEIQEKQKAEKEGVKTQTASMKGNSELRHKLETEQRERVEKENAQTLADEIDRIKMEIEQEKAELKLKAAEGAQYTSEQAIKLEMEIVELKAERSIMSMRISALENDKKKLKTNLEEAYKNHKEEMEIQQLQHFQTFRNYREVFEEQKAGIEQRYRTLLEEAIQDAVFLSTRNQELMQENQSLQQELDEMKDQMSLRGNIED